MKFIISGLVVFIVGFLVWFSAEAENLFIAFGFMFSGLVIIIIGAVQESRKKMKPNE